MSDKMFSKDEVKKMVQDLSEELFKHFTSSLDETITTRDDSSDDFLDCMRSGRNFTCIQYTPPPVVQI